MKKKNKKIYKKDFWDQQIKGSFESANEIVPIVINLVNPKSVIDVGCGTGTWADVFKKKGVKKVTGIDGNYVDRKKLYLKEEEFIPKDLTKPLKLKEKFDLAISLEVAEHLPEKSAEIFIDSLTGLSDIILFSAAIPYQRGTNHINEQFPEYWIDKFKKRNYLVIDCIRKKIWNNPKVYFFYSQNILLFIKKECLRKNAKLRGRYEKNKDNMVSVIHPENYLIKAKRLQEIKDLIPFKNLLMPIFKLFYSSS